MAGAVVTVSGLPDEPGAAAAAFHAQWGAQLRSDIAAAEDPVQITIIFEHASHEHKGWRLAAVQDLARMAAPGRVNALVAADAADAARAVAYLENAPAVTGQMLTIDAIEGESV